MTDSTDTHSDSHGEPADSLDGTPCEALEASASELSDPDETLLDQLDRRQNHVLAELDELDARIQTLVSQCQVHRSDAA